MSNCRRTIKAEAWKFFLSLHQCKCAGCTMFLLAIVLSNCFFKPKISQSFYIALGRNCIRRRNRKWLKARVVFLFVLLWLVFPFMVFQTGSFCSRQHRIEISCHFCFCVAWVKLLQCLRLFEIFLTKYCSAGVTELYPILFTLGNWTLS